MLMERHCKEHKRKEEAKRMMEWRHEEYEQKEEAKKMLMKWCREEHK